MNISFPTPASNTTTTGRRNLERMAAILLMGLHLLVDGAVLWSTPKLWTDLLVAMRAFNPLLLSQKPLLYSPWIRRCSFRWKGVQMYSCKTTGIRVNNLDNGLCTGRRTFPHTLQGVYKAHAGGTTGHPGVYMYYFDWLWVIFFPNEDASILFPSV